MIYSSLWLHDIIASRLSPICSMLDACGDPIGRVGAVQPRSMSPKSAVLASEDVPAPAALAANAQQVDVVGIRGWLTPAREALSETDAATETARAKHSAGAARCVGNCVAPALPPSPAAGVRCRSALSPRHCR